MHAIGYSFARRFALALLCTALSTFALGQQFTTLHSFNQTEGEFPYSGLTHGPDGNLYGTAIGGGSHGCGTVFKISESGQFTTIYNFAGGNDGCNPETSVTLDAAGNIYGTTDFGGPSNAGTVFQVTHSGQESVVYAFTGGTDGGAPYGGVIPHRNGILYGVTLGGGDLSCPSFANGCGTVFEIDASGTETVLHAFTGGDDGQNPFGGLVIDSTGSLYGTTEFGGTFAAGNVFKIDPSGNFTVIYDFDPNSGTGDGNSPRADLTLGGGEIFGTTYAGGRSCDCGVVFEIAHRSESVLYAFAGGTSDGSTPSGPVSRDAAGNIFGTTSSGGVSGTDGVVYELSPAGAETILHYFTDGTDGGVPVGSLYVDGQGNVFGTAVTGGTAGYGVVFKIAP